MSQRYHLPRALYLAQHFGLDAIGASCDGAGRSYGRTNAAREALARVLAWLDANVFHTGPELGGPKERI